MAEPMTEEELRDLRARMGRVPLCYAQESDTTIERLLATVDIERRAHATELAHVSMSEREADAARIADLERRLDDSDDSHGRTIEQRDLLEAWAEELHAALGCEREASNLHDYFACIRDNALTLLSHYESVERRGGESASVVAQDPKPLRPREG